MTIAIEMLPADYGDSLLVSWDGQASTHRMLIDGGLVKSAEPIKARLEEVGGVDLAVMTHVDGDHIGGLLAILRDPQSAPLVPAIWFNAYAHLERSADLLGPVQGEQLTEVLAESGTLAWNERWPFEPEQSRGRTGGPVVRNGLPPTIGLPGGATVTLLAPTPVGLTRLETVWAEDVRKAGLQPGVEREEEPPTEERADMLGPVVPLEELATKRSGTDGSRANGSSIAFVLEHEGTRVLLAGDAHPKDLIEGLAALQHGDEPYRLDAFKLPHHASKKNVSNDLVAAVSCSNWLVSTSGERFSHPNDEALARVITGCPTPPRLIGNYRSERWATFTERYPPESNGYELTLPAPGEHGIEVIVGT